MASEGSSEPGCLFCDIIRGAIPAYKVYEDETTLAFLDAFPHTRGHLLIVPKRHMERITDLAEAEYSDFFRGIANVCRRVDRLSRHYHVSINQGSLAGQVVFHLHVHVIPRYGEENPFAVHPRPRLDEAEARALVGTLSPD
jgi:diadenosine tetraphosphate (Ap4A) HIT family hydrolase